MLPGSVDFSGPVVNWRSRVSVNGRAVESLEWSCDRAMCHVPGDTDAAGRSADASVKPAPAPAVVNQAPTPWQPLNGWPPRQGDKVTVEVSQNGRDWFPVITNALADKPTGTLSGDLSVDLIEKVDRFTRNVSTRPMQWIMYPSTPGGSLRATDMNHQWHLNRACEVAGFWTTMSPAPNTALRVSMQGSRWPEIGVCTYAYINGSELGDSRAYCAWGSCAVNFSATYEPDGGLPSLEGSVDLRVMIPSGRVRSDIASPTGTVRLTLLNGSDAIASINIDTAARTASVTGDGGRFVSISGITDILGVRRSGTTWTLYVEGKTASGSGSSGSTQTITSVKVAADTAAAVGAIHAGRSSGDAPSVVWSPSALFYGGANNITQLSASPSVNQSAADLMDAIGSATFVHWGFDELGRVAVIPVFGRLDNNPCRTITDDADIVEDVTWSQDWQAAASQVVVKLKYPYSRIATQPSVLLSEQSGSTLEPGEIAVDIVDVPDDEDWIAVDAGHTLTSPTTSDRIWYGSIFIGNVDVQDNNDKTPDERPALYDEYSGSVERITDTTYKLTRQAKTYTRVNEGSGDFVWLPKSLRKHSMPLIRGYQKTSWVDASISTDDNGADAPVFEHDAGKWVGAHGDYTASSLQQFLAVDRVTLSEIEIRPDPRLQLGDVISVRLTTAGVTVTGIVTGKKLAYSDGMLSMSITVLIGSSYVDAATWGAFEDYMANSNWQIIEDAGQLGATYDQWENSPLHLRGD